MRQEFVGGFAYIDEFIIYVRMLQEFVGGFAYIRCDHYTCMYVTTVTARSLEDETRNGDKKCESKS